MFIQGHFLDVEEYKMLQLGVSTLHKEKNVDIHVFNLCNENNRAFK